MEGDKLPDSFDVVIIGTGLGEAIVAASLSRIGKSVLHIDRNDYYGSHWATFNFDSILKWADCYQKCNEEEISDENDKVPSHDSAISNIEIRSFIPETSPVNDIAKSEETSSEKDSSAASNSEKEDVPSNDENTPAEANCENESTEQPSINQEAVTDNSEGVEPQEDEQQKSEEKPKPSFFNPPKQSTIVSQAKIKQKSPDISLEDFNALSRRFNLDVNPKFLFSAGPLVNAIIKANISHYSEFQVVNRILTCKNDSIIEVPCNRSDIFSSSFLSMIEKRTLMKFLTLCLEFDADSPSEDVKKYQEKSFVEFLQSRRLSENLQKFIIFSIAMVKPNTSTLEGLKETCSFLKSLGRYGKSPFIWPLYGVGELPQAFCRMSAVFGALYCLGKSPVELKIEENKCTHVVLENQTIKCAHVVMNRSFLPQSYLNPSVSRNKVSKAILITNGSILPSETEFISFLTIPPLAGKEELVRVIELGPSAAACPAGLYVLYLTCKSTGKALQD
ncbi:rab proteins geranylgeranyltransferase component A 1-like [Clytia hemisphaerica]|uniref:rab proteins geranylgeranyltransferase component A 1-like n=1 Tax=Clytia hemisphaerica TaxID=252671 RepID=UPI0034D57D34